MVPDVRNGRKYSVKNHGELKIHTTSRGGDLQVSMFQLDHE